MSLYGSSRRPLSTEEYLRVIFGEADRRKNRDHTPRTLQPDGSQTTEDWLREVVFGTERPEPAATPDARATVPPAPGISPTPATAVPAGIASIAEAGLSPEEPSSPLPSGWGTTLFSGRGAQRSAAAQSRAAAEQGTTRTVDRRTPAPKTLLTADAGKTISDAGGAPADSAPVASGSSERTLRDEILRGLGLGTRGVADGVLNVADTIALPARVPFNLINGWAGGDPNYFKPLAGTVPDALGLPRPETPFENLAYQANSGLTSMLTTYGLGSLIGFGPTAAAAPTATQVIGKALTANPGAQAVSATASGVALGAAQNAGVGPAGQFAAATLAGMATPGGGTKGAGPSRAASAARNLETAALESRQPLKTTAHETGVSGLPTAQWKLMQTQDWLDAKGGDLVAAQRIVDQVWTPAKTEQLRAKLAPGREPVFVSVPSTSGTNRIPDALGLRLAQELDGAYVDVGKLYSVTAKSAMKEVAKWERPFSPRSYELKDARTMAALRDKQVVITEDVLTTGSSARQFALELRRQGVEAHTVAGLMGSARLDAPPQLLSNLQKTLRNAGLEIKGRDLADVLSAGEIEVIIEQIHKAGDAYARRTLAQRIQGILNSRTAGPVGRHP